ncbi:serine--tRNA ligase [Candidatus Sumerlaeota bacterium]|nr:serine--tRNA ligase [Candidatus Sumerlaeota bacterium]
MLDIRLFRDAPDRVREKLRSRGLDIDVVDQILALDEKRRALVQRTEEAKARRNEISKQIPQLAKAKQPIDALKEKSRSLGEEITAADNDLALVDASLDELMLGIPNLPDDSVPMGKSEHDNVVRRTHGEARKFDFAPKAHWDLGESLGILDLPRGAKISGSGFYVLRGLGAKLERALISWMLDTHTQKNGYTEFSVPYVVGEGALRGTSQLPKFADQLYTIPEDALYLIPTAEVPVTNLHADEILEPDQLPIAYCAHTPCFRREAGAAGRENRGISRIHQFHKVELVHITRPEESPATHERLVGHAEDLLKQLGLHYRVLELCTADLGFGAAKCYDLELWAPGMNTWLEVSSCSNFETFQARRANIKYRAEKGGRPALAHTLNGSGLALPRLMIALLENYQRADGSVEVPAVLRDRLGVSELRPGG